MKIEMNEESSFATCFVAVCITILVIAFMVYRYNAVAFEQGYTQQQLENSQFSMWVKPPSQ